ncbi:MAG: protein kinase [Polyangiaceae bacterium]
MTTPRGQAFAPGALFHGRYRLVRELGAGGMATVYEVFDETTRARRALKIMHPSVARRPELRARFAQEGRVTANVQSDHLARVHDTGLDGDTPFIVMDLLEGEDLDAIVRTRGRLSLGDACALLAQVANGLAATHAAGILHRDLKPENLFVTRRQDGAPCVKILDFGVAKVFSGASAPLTRAVGTPLFMAPEQVRGDGDVGPAADVHALVHVAYALLVGEPYWSEEASSNTPGVGLMVRALDGLVEPASTRARRRVGVELPPGFDAWFARGVAKDARQRFPSAPDAVDALVALDDTLRAGASARRGHPTDLASAPSGSFASDPTIAPFHPTGYASAPSGSIANDPTIAPTNASDLERAPTFHPAVPLPAPAAHPAQPGRTLPSSTLVSAQPGWSVSPTSHGAPTSPPPEAAPEAHPARAPSSARKMFWMGAGAGGAVALSGAAIATVVLLSTGNTNPPPGRERSARPVAVGTSAAAMSSSAPAPPLPTASARGVKRVECWYDACADLDFPDLAAVDPDALLQRMVALARVADPEARLSDFLARELWKDGRFDLRNQPILSAMFTGPKKIVVSVFEGRLIASSDRSTLARTPFPTVGCTLARMLEVAQAKHPQPGPWSVYFMTTSDPEPIVRIIGGSDSNYVDFEPATCAIKRST